MASMINQYPISKLIPQEIADQLIAIRDQTTACFWRVGDLANEAYELSVANGFEVHKMQVYGAVAAYTGDSVRTVRYYASAAGFYPPDVREYYGVLPFSHFVYAMGFQGSEPDGKPTWQVILEKSLDYMGDHGVPPSRERLDSLYHIEIVHQREQLGEMAFVENTPDPIYETGLFGPQAQVPVSPEQRLVYAVDITKKTLHQLNQLVTMIAETEKVLGLPEKMAGRVAGEAVRIRALIEELEEYAGAAGNVYLPSRDYVSDPA